jgi:lysophospholipase L1-like esterase
MQKKNHYKFWITICLLVILFIGCGGNGEEDADNQAPSADAGSDQTVSIPESETLVITLAGTANDSDGTIATHQWTQTGGEEVTLSNANSASPSFTAEATEATYTFSYTVTDNEGATGTDEVNITVIINDPPTADAGADQTVSVAASGSQTVTLTGSGTDSNGTISAHQWEQTGGAASLTLTGANTASVSFTVPGVADTYTFTYTVTDDDGATGTDEVSVIVSLNSPPVVDAGTNQFITLASPDTLTLTGSATDSDGSIEAHLWEQTGGPTLALTNADTEEVSFTVPATTAAYTFSYTATDDSDEQATDTVAVYVSSEIYSDAFSSDANWQTRVDQSLVASNWYIDSGRLLQNNNVYDNDDAFYNNSSYRIGTYTVLDAGQLAGATDYRVSVDITPLTNNADGSSNGNDIGIMFRYVDSANYYRVSMNARNSYTRFEKVVGGTFTTLAVNAIGYVDNTAMTMTAEVNGNVIFIWLDGDPLFAVVDSDISSGTVALYCQDRVRFDNLSIVEPPSQPAVVIQAPLAYSVPLTQSDGNALATSAVVLNAPSGGSVGFVLDDGTEMTATASGSVYSYTFSGVTDGEHDLEARLRDADGNMVSNDINSTIGVGGNYIVTVGDSITNGTGDDSSANNDSADGRIVGIQGYQALLADALTETTRLPQIILNEGVGGDRSEDLDNKMNSIMERHPGANMMLMMIGTNDARNPVLTNAQYEANVTAAINKMGDRLILYAKPMHTYLSDGSWTYNPDRNGNIEGYNTVVDSIVAATSGIYAGPDFYNHASFSSPTYYADYLHPNDGGYQIMAAEWHDAVVSVP